MVQVRLRFVDVLCSVALFNRGALLAFVGLIFFLDPLFFRLLRFFGLLVLSFPSSWHGVVCFVCFVAFVVFVL